MEVLILIVCHNGAKTVLSTIKSCLLSRMDISVLTVDNGSTDETLALISDILDVRFEVIPLGDNAGLGAAYNIGIETASSRKINWLYILDQDSELEADCLEKLLHSARNLLKDDPKVAAVSPTVRCRPFPEIIHYPLNWNGSRFVPVIQEVNSTEFNPVRADSPISSGTLYRVDVLVAIGGFDETYFIDFVDHDCHLRLKKAGYSVWWEKSAQLVHQLGAVQKMTDSGLWIEHAPFRYYYMARNMTRGYFRYGGLASMLAFWKRDLFPHILKLQKYGRYPYTAFFYVVRGCLDAVIGKSGKLDSKI